MHVYSVKKQNRYHQMLFDHSKIHILMSDYLNAIIQHATALAAKKKNLQVEV